jgi:glycosyltransferase involved in cell wall biosynthesis
MPSLSAIQIRNMQKGLSNKLANRIAFAGDFKFPTGDAYSPRAVGIGKILRLEGYETCYQGVNSNHDTSDDASPYQGFQYKNFQPIKSAASPLFRIKSTLFSGYLSAARLASGQGDYSHVILKSCHGHYLYPFLSMARRKKWSLLVDVVEWYDYSHLPYGRIGPLALDVHLAMTQLIPKASGVIAISTYLEDYYKQRGVRTIRIPQIVDLDEAKWNFSIPESFDPTSLNLVYAGVPGKKDLIGNAIRGLKVLSAQGVRIKLHLFGPTRNDVKSCLNADAGLVDELDGNAIIFYGRISQEEIPRLLAKGDYSLLIRPNERYAKAGFPTKLVESFAAGIPMIANLTGDIGMYLHDGITGFALEDWSQEAFVAKIKEVVLLPRDRRIQMRQAAKTECWRSFEYRNYRQLLHNFIAP